MLDTSAWSRADSFVAATMTLSFVPSDRAPMTLTRYLAMSRSPRCCQVKNTWRRSSVELPLTSVYIHGTSLSISWLETSTHPQKAIEHKTEEGEEGITQRVHNLVHVLQRQGLHGVAIVTAILKNLISTLQTHRNQKEAQNNSTVFPSFIIANILVASCIHGLKMSAMAFAN